MKSADPAYIKSLRQLKLKWQKYWPQALALWSRYVRLKEPVYCFTKKAEKIQGLSDSFAMIRLVDHSVVISLRIIARWGLEKFALEILAHEIGHHVYCPADLTDLARLTARIQRALLQQKHFSGLVGNLYTDLLINNRLFRHCRLQMDFLYKSLASKPQGKLWQFYMRTYEILWSLQRGTLATAHVGHEMEGDAHLASSLLRSYARDWLRGAGQFATLCLTYILEDIQAMGQEALTVWMDASTADDKTALPAGLTEIEEDELSGALYPQTEGLPPLPQSQRKKEKPNYREPFEYGQILKGMGINLDDHEIAIRYYRERAIPHLIPYPTVTNDSAKEPLPEGFDTWDIGQPLEQINWLETVMRNPVVVPGLTTLKQVFGKTEGTEKEREPIDLDLYVDCSGSMPNPAVNISYPTLAGAIISLSALRSGARVQATLWSGTNQFMTTKGFVRNEKEILHILTGYFGDGTAFPIHMLRETYNERKSSARKVHILVISDSGVTTMFDEDEKGNSGEDIARMALQKAGAGGTLVLNLYGSWQNNGKLVLANEMSFDIVCIKNWKNLVAFSRDFSKKKYGEK